MKLLAKLFAFSPLLVLCFELIYLTNLAPRSHLSPTIPTNQKYEQLVTTVNLSGLSTSSWSLSPQKSEVKFNCQQQPNSSFVAILSLNESPYIQVAALQKLLKIANMKSKQIKFVDLSSPRPYATL